MLRSNSKIWGIHVVSPEEETEGYSGKDLSSEIYSSPFKGCGDNCGPGEKQCQPTAGFMTHVTCRLTAKNSALHPSWVDKSTTSFAGRNVRSAGWQVTPCDPIRHVSSRSGEASCQLLYSVYSS